MNYVMDCAEEFERLEKQSRFPAYDYRAELRDLRVPDNARVLDAGCGSGIVSRYLAKEHGTSQVTGCDLSADRVRLAAQAGRSIRNLSFQVEDVSKLSFDANSFEVIVCRYVVEHLPPASQFEAAEGFYRCTAPGGEIVIVDFDGGFMNLYPQTPLVSQVLTEISKSEVVDLNVGRKIPGLLWDAGFTDVKHQIQTINFDSKELLANEAELIRERLQAARPFLETITSDPIRTSQFIKEYIECLQQPGVVLFYNKFIVSGKKPKRPHLKVQAFKPS